MDSNPSDRNLRALASAAFGAASICFAGVLFLLASPRHDQIFHWPGPASAIFVPTLVDEFLLSLGIFAILAVVRRSGWPRRVVWAGLLCFLIFAIVHNVIFIEGSEVSRRQQHILIPLCFLLVIVTHLCLKTPIFELIRGSVQFLLMCSAFAGAVLFIEVCWFGFECRHLNDPKPVAPIISAVPANSAPHGRVIWIVLDELAYRQTFVDHTGGTDLPAFDALKEQSTLFTNVVPAGNYTETVIPSLITGEHVRDARSTADGHLQLMKGAADTWVDFDTRNTVFSDAQSLGYHTAIAGWYIPYCRILNGTFSFCLWAFHIGPAHLYPSDKIVENLLTPILHPRTLSTELHIQDTVKLTDASDQILRANQYDFVYLHMPFPHPPGIYNSRQKRYDPNHSSYIDNLALADAYIAHLCAVLQTQGEWDDATILLTGDHSWRIWLWNNKKEWTKEEELASSHGFDPRPVYLIKLPHQKTAATVSSEFHALRTRLLLDGLLRGQFHSPEDIQSWAATASPLADH